MTKARRQALLKRVLGTRALKTQEELSDALAAEGARASQVTLSRDLRELGFVKTPDGYREPGLAAAPAPDRDEISRTFAEFLTAVETAQNLVVVKTQEGGAGPVALALDRGDFDEIVGTVAGDDTIFVATKSADEAERLRRSLVSLW